MKKRVLSLLLALAMFFALTACGGGNTTESTTPNNPDTENNTPEGPSGDYLDFAALDALLAEDKYDDVSWTVYEYHLGAFYDKLTEAKAETSNLSLRWAMEAQAEALLEEAAFFIPFNARGGQYAISRVIPRTDTTTGWGLDDERFGYTMVADTFLTPAERAELTAKWAESETEADYYAYVETWLADKGYGKLDAYKTGITGSGPQTWDVLVTSKQADSRYIAPTYSPLIRYDGKDTQQPALAESWEVSDDGLTYTFHIREGLQWVDQQGRKVADLTAQDFVTGLHHCADFPNALGYLLSSDGGCGIKNWDAFVSGEITDFAEVGVEAVDDYTVVYTLESPFPAFLSMLGYNCFAPLSESYFFSQGGAYGADLDPTSSSYVYGTDPSHIAYCGEFLINNYTEGSVLRYSANPTFWDADNMNIHELVYTWYDGSDVMAPYNNTISGVFTGCNLTTNTIQQAKIDTAEGSDATIFDAYAYTTSIDTTSYVGFYNVMRQAFANVADDSKAVSVQTEEDAARTRVAMNNNNFRLALTYAADRSAYQAARVGEELKYAGLINSYVPGNFVKLTEDVTLDMGDGTEQTFPAGTYFGEIVQAQLDFDGVKAKVWDPTGDDGVGSSGGFDGWFNPDEAVARLEKAVAELAEQGVEVSAENPIYIDYPYWSTNENYANSANVYKQSIEMVLGGAVIVNMVPCETDDDWYYAGYYTDYGYESNYDMYDLSGWGPDYQDPSSYLDTFLPDYSGYMIKCIGIF